MLSKELLLKVKLIEITTRKIVDDVLSGQYRTHFKGQGVQFSEHRLYVPGDDVRHINWNVSARTREPLVKKFDEEREVSVFIVVDISASHGFGSHAKLKSEIAAQVGGMLAYAASHAGDKVGVLLFAGKVEKIIPPKKGQQHILRVIRDILSYTPESKGTQLAVALDATGRIMKHSGVVFILSDFRAEKYESALKRLASTHDVVVVSLGDEREQIMPDIGQILFVDPETGDERFVNTSSYAFKNWFQAEQERLETYQKNVFKKSGVEVLKILTKDDYAEAVVRFFRARARRKR